MPDRRDKEFETPRGLHRNPPERWAIVQFGQPHYTTPARCGIRYKERRKGGGRACIGGRFYESGTRDWLGHLLRLPHRSNVLLWELYRSHHRDVPVHGTRIWVGIAFATMSSAMWPVPTPPARLRLGCFSSAPLIFANYDHPIAEDARSSGDAVPDVLTCRSPRAGYMILSSSTCRSPASTTIRSTRCRNSSHGARTLSGEHNLKADFGSNYGVQFDQPRARLGPPSAKEMLGSLRC